METDVKLIFCGGGNRKATRIAQNMGLLLGAQLPDKLYEPIYFADQNWKNPQKDLYIQSVKDNKPKLATVLDLERPDQLEEVIDWSIQVSEIADKIIIIPKYAGAIDDIPLHINGKEVILGYSVPTKYGGTSVSLKEFADRKVHLLGGKPHYQLSLYRHLNVYSIDTNWIMLAALTYNCFWSGMYNDYSRIWVQMKDIGLDEGQNWNYVAFALSCSYLKRAWEDIQNGQTLNFEKKYSKFLSRKLEQAAKC